MRKYAYRWRYDTPAALTLLNQLWPLVLLRMNYLTPTKKPTGWTTDHTGKRRRIFDTPRTPLDRLLASDILTRSQRDTLLATRDTLNPADLARNIDRIQQHLTALAKTPTLELEAATLKPLPDTHKGVKLAKAS